jgi:hypothetical protein
MRNKIKINNIRNRIINTLEVSTIIAVVIGVFVNISIQKLSGCSINPLIRIHNVVAESITDKNNTDL